MDTRNAVFKALRHTDPFPIERKKWLSLSLARVG